VSLKIKKQLKGIIIDFDNTLGRFPLDLTVVRQELAKKIEELTGRRLLFSPYLVTIDNYVDNPEIKQQLYDIIESLEFEVAEKFELFPEVITKLDEFKQEGLQRFAIFANNSENVINHILKENGLEHWFNPVIGLRSVNFHKPEPEGLQKIINSWGFKAWRVMYVGDVTPDAHAAARARMQYQPVVDFIELDLNDYKIMSPEEGLKRKEKSK